VDADEARSTLQRLAVRRAEAQRARTESAAALAEAIPQARAAGLEVREITQLTGMSKQAVYKLLGPSS
jgi:hypothetical protein